MRFRLPALAIAIIGCLGIASSLAAQGISAPIDFDREVAPLLAAQCLDCHSGPKPRGGLDLSTKRTALRGGKRGQALVPGKLDESLLWERVEADHMPPKHPLSKAEKQILKRWIEDGGVWGSDPIDPFRFTTNKRAGYDWWALQPLRRPDIPVIAKDNWARNGIDRFLLSQLDSAGLRPSPEADRRTLLRRLSFDLIGLPPSPEEVDAFLADKQPDAYERQVERLLASPHYGERWARHWLDVVRFGESDGFERNGTRPNAWHYRDWVIRALNADMPYDEFCRLQIAGDVLAPADPDAIRATGYLVAGIHNTVLPMNKVAKETAVQDELEDLVGNVGQTFLGLTVNCARCHDHKFDPISQKDYYRLASSLAGVRHGERLLPARIDSEKLKHLQTDIASLSNELAKIETPLRNAILAERKNGKGPTRKLVTPMAYWDFREGLNDRIGALHASLVGGAKLTKEGLKVDGKSFARSAPLANDLQAKTLEAWVRLDNVNQRGGGVLTVQSLNGATFDAIVFAEKDEGQWLAGSDFFRRTQGFAGPKETEPRLVHIAISHQADGTITAYRDGVPYGKSYRPGPAITLPKGKANVGFGIRHEPLGGNRMFVGVIQKAKLYDRALNADEIAASAERDDFVAQSEIVARLSATDKKVVEELRSKRLRLQAELSSLTERQKGQKIYAALSSQPTPTRFLKRGQVNDVGDVVSPAGIASLVGVPADFGLAPDAPENSRREKLAEWITHRDNPLFSRVLVNRLWHYYFGTGLVDTPSDFGFNGSRPSHPKLLDWLAVEFKEKGYRLKDMHRLIVHSSAYRQMSTPRPDGMAKDADSRLLWRRKRSRMEGEVLRDSMLAVTGLLNREIGGKGFSDYKETGGAGTSYFDPFDPVGAAFHRRSIYRFQPRSASLGFLDAFDCPDPSASSPRRNVTTTPLQALALWNGPFALRMADALADRVTKEAPESNRIDLAFRLVYQRGPTDEEREASRQIVAEHGLRPLCRVLLNTNEFLTIE